MRFLQTQGQAMKKFIKASPLILVTFIIGVLATLCSARLYARRVSLCEVAQNPSAYEGKLVRIEAFGSAISRPPSEWNSVYIYETGCTGGGVVSSVWLDSDFQPSLEVDEFVNSETPEIREAKVVVEGVFDEVMGCFGPPFIVRNATVTLKSAVTSKPLPPRE